MIKIDDVIRNIENGTTSTLHIEVQEALDNGQDKNEIIDIFMQARKYFNDVIRRSIPDTYDDPEKYQAYLNMVACIAGYIQTAYEFIGRLNVGY